MGPDYPHYTPDGGVRCYVLEAKSRAEWIPDYYVPTILYWLDRHTFFPLRIEQYDPSGNLVYIEERIAQHFNPALGNMGYSSNLILQWDVPQDLLSYDIHDAHQVRKWSKRDQEVFFNPDFMRRVWFVAPLKSQATVESPEQFFLRPHLYPDKFPGERSLAIPAPVQERVEAQETDQRLVFVAEQAAE